MFTPSLGVRGRCEVLGLCSRLGRVRPTAWHHSPTSAPSQRVRFHFHAALLLDARRLWIVGCGSRFCMRCRTFGVVMVCIMSSSHSMCIITAGGSRVTICGRVLGARVGSGAGPVPRPGATAHGFGRYIFSLMRRPAIFIKGARVCVQVVVSRGIMYFFSV